MGVIVKNKANPNGLALIVTPSGERSNFLMEDLEELLQFYECINDEQYKFLV